MNRSIYMKKRLVDARKRLGVVWGKVDRIEWRVVSQFIDDAVLLSEQIAPDRVFWFAAVAEEALSCLIVSNRFLAVLREEGVVLGAKPSQRKSGSDADGNAHAHPPMPAKASSTSPKPEKTHPAVDGFVKTQERFRKAMKELLEMVEAERGTKVVGLPSLMAPIIEKAEGVLEYALEPRKSERISDEKGPVGAGDGSVATGP